MPRWQLILGFALLLAGAPWATLARPQSPPSAEKTQRCPTFPGANQFVQTIDNRFLPLEPGTTFIYREKADGETNRDVVAVTNQTKTILGVETVVVRDTATDCARRPRRGHAGLVRPGQSRQRLVLRGRHQRVQKRPRRQHRGLMASGGQGRQAGHRDGGEPAPWRHVPAGVRLGGGRGRGQGAAPR